MLVRMRGSTTKIDEWTHQLNFDIPVLYLDNSDYNLSLRMICFDYNFTDGMPTKQFWSLQTTAVDRTAVNPSQEISSFCAGYEKGSSYNMVCYEPNIARDYIIQIHDFHTSEFHLVSLTPDAGLEIQFVEILFEISEYARI